MYRKVCVAGTFEGMHTGHEAMLKRAFEVGEEVLIGLTSDTYTTTHKKNALAYATRKKLLEHWLYERQYIRYSIVSIDDPYGPAVRDESIEALVVSEETKARGEDINRKRKKPLELIVVPLVKTDDGKKVSSSDLRMPHAMRKTLGEPLGPVVAQFQKENIITVGDVTTKTALDAGITPRLMIIDRKVNRKPYDEVPLTGVHVKSGPGYISKEAIELIKNMKSGVIEVDGEEDLLVLPVIAEAPIGTVVYYGQPGQGMVEVQVTEEKKQEVKEILSQFLSP